MADVPVEKGVDEAAKRIGERISLMNNAKQPIRDIWQGVQDLLQASSPWILTGEDWNQPVRFATLHDVIEAMTDLYMQDYPQVILRAKELSYQDFVRAKQAKIDQALESIHEKKVRRQVIKDMMQWGIGFRVPEFRTVPKGSGGYQFDDLCTHRINPRDVLIDESCSQIHDPTGFSRARDLVIRRIMPHSTYKDWAGKNNLPTDVIPVSYFQAVGQDITSVSDKEQQEKMQAMTVKVFEYRNQETGEFTLLANGETIRQTTLKEATGSEIMNVVAYEFEARNDSPWPLTLGELVAPIIYTQDTLLNLELMNLKLTLQPVLAVSSEFGFNSSTNIVQPGGTWISSRPLANPVSNYITPIISGNPNTRYYEMDNRLQSQLAITSRTNVRPMEYYKDKTATEINKQSELANQHIMTIRNANEIESEGLLVSIMCEQMENCMTDSHVDGSPRHVKIKDYAVNQEEGKEPKFTEKPGHVGFFRLTEEVIKAGSEIDVIDRRSDELNRNDKIGRLMQALPIIGQLGQVDPTALQGLSLANAIQELLQSIGVRTEKVYRAGETSEESIEAYRQEILLGNKVVLPAEKRFDAIQRQKMLLSMRYEEDGEETDLWKNMNTLQRSAWQDQLDQTEQNIKRPQVGADKAVTENTATAIPQSPAPGSPSPAGAPPPSVANVDDKLGANLPPRGNIPVEITRK